MYWTKWSLIGTVFWPAVYFSKILSVSSQMTIILTDWTVNDVMWFHLYDFHHSYHLSVHLHPMKPTSSTQCSIVISLLQEGYSLHQIQSKTGLEKSTVGRIKKKMDGDGENNKGGCPSKLSPADKWTIICQITTGRCDNAVEAAHFINNILPNPITPHTIRNTHKQNNIHSIVKRKCPLLKKAHWVEHLKFAKYHENWTVEDWKRILWSDEMKINRIGSDGRAYTWKKKGGTTVW